MEMIKSVVKQFYPLLVMMGCVSFAVYTFFSTDINSGEGMFEVGGNLYNQILGTDEVKTDGLNYIGGSPAGDVPMVAYASGVQKAGTNLIFKGLLNVKKSNGTTVSASTEDDFALYLIGIKTLEGESVLETLSTEEIENLGEIPSAFIYDKATDRLYIYSSGIYIVQVKIYGSSGGQQIYEFQLPVESM